MNDKDLIEIVEVNQLLRISLKPKKVKRDIAPHMDQVARNEELHSMRISRNFFTPNLDTCFPILELGSWEK